MPIKRIAIDVKSFPTLRMQYYGYFQMFTSPTAEPTITNMNDKLLPFHFYQS
ncbi:hypothetical protein [Methanobrevibacter sp.]|uniref:hypothetical protein n=1 Tax=Methanobrevibacter sp. TaxID=66852 RepID=UPI00386EEB74